MLVKILSKISLFFKILLNEKFFYAKCKSQNKNKESSFLKNVSNKIKNKSFLEIGFHNGYTNTILDKVFEFKNNVAIDLVDQPCNAEAFRANHRFKNLTMICGDSTSKRVIDTATNLGPYDMIFIDGCHEEYYVNEDYRNYSKMLRNRGILVFHDIYSPRFKGVARVWEEVKREHDTFYQFKVPNGNMTCGIGFAIVEK